MGNWGKWGIIALNRKNAVKMEKGSRKGRWKWGKLFFLIIEN